MKINPKQEKLFNFVPVFIVVTYYIIKQFKIYYFWGALNFLNIFRYNNTVLIFDKKFFVVF